MMPCSTMQLESGSSRSTPKPWSFPGRTHFGSNTGISDPILLDNGYAVLQFVRELAPQKKDPAEVRDEMERLVRISQERLLMDQFAKRLLASAQVTIFDESLNDAWTRARRARNDTK